MAELNFELPQFHDSMDEVPPPCVTPFIVGHEQSLAQMWKAAIGGHHALILDGERGIGKATAAFHLANSALSEQQPLTPGSPVMPALNSNSTTYRQIAQNVHPNLLYISRPRKDDGKGFKTVITVDEIRRLNRFLGMSAAAGSKRVIIIDSLGDMNRNAANAILKLLEEPPMNTLFLLISHGIGSILPTIRSRCQVVRFSPLGQEGVQQVLNNLAATLIPGSDHARLAALSNGSVRHALMMARSDGLELRDTLKTLLESPNFDTVTAHKLADVAGQRGSDEHNQLLRELVLDAIQHAALKSASDGNIHRSDKLAQFSSDFSRRARVADGYNLDRRQEFLIAANQLHALFQDV